MSKDTVCILFFVVAFGSLLLPVGDTAKGIILVADMIIFLMYVVIYTKVMWDRSRDKMAKTKKEMHDRIRKKLEEEENA
jgi:hypothetical protein